MDFGPLLLRLQVSENKVANLEDDTRMIDEGLSQISITDKQEPEVMITSVKLPKRLSPKNAKTK